MKKALTFVLALFLVLMLVSCSADYYNDYTYYDDGSFSHTDKSGQISFSINSLPFTMTNGEVDIPLEQVSFYEVYGNHSYMGFVIVSIDRHNLTDDDIYWMVKRESLSDIPEIDANVYLTHEKNELDSERLSVIHKSYDEEYLYFVLSSDAVRYDLKDCKISAQIIISPDKSIIADTTIYYHYSPELDSTIDYTQLDHLTTGEIDVLVDALSD